MDMGQHKDPGWKGHVNVQGVQLGRETQNGLEGRLKVRRTSTGRRTSDSNGMIYRGDLNLLVLFWVRLGEWIIGCTFLNAHR